MIKKTTKTLKPSMPVATPSKEHIVCDSLLIDGLKEIQGKILHANLILFNMFRFDVILGMG